MSSSLRLFLVVIGSVAAGAVATYLVVRPAAPPVSAVAAAAGPAEGAPVAPALAASATDVPAAPTLVHSPALQGDPAGEYVIGSSDSTAASGTAEKALDMASIVVGSGDAIQGLRRATYRLTLGGPLRRSVTAVVDATLGIVVRDDESGEEQGRVGGVCYVKQRGAVLGCRHGDAMLLQALHWMHRGQLVKPLLDSPWRISGSGAQMVNGRVLNSISFEVPGAAPSGEVTAVATLDPRGRRLLGVSVNAVKIAGEEPPNELPRPGAKDKQGGSQPGGGPGPGPEGDRADDRSGAAGQIALEFSEPRSFAGLQLAGTLRVRTPLDGARGRDVTVHVIDVSRGGEVPKTAPAFAVPKGLSSSSRLHGTAMVFPLEGHDQCLSRLAKLSDEVLLNAVADQFDAVEAFGPLGGERSEGVQLWLVPRWPSALTSPGVQPHVASVPVAVKVVGRFAQVAVEQVPAEVAMVLAEVEAAGHKPAGGQRTTVAYLDRDPQSGRVTIRVDVPVQ